MQEMQDMLVQSLGQEDPLEKVMGPQSSILAWKIPWAMEPGELQTVGPKRVRHDWVTELTPTEAVLPGAISSLSPDYRSDLVLGAHRYPCSCGYLQSFPPFLVLNWNLSPEPLFTKDDLRLSQNSVWSSLSVSGKPKFQHVCARWCPAQSGPFLNLFPFLPHLSGGILDNPSSLLFLTE